MKKLKNLKARLLSLSLAFAMVLSLAMGMAPMNVYAEGENPTPATSTLTYNVVGGSGNMETDTLTVGESFTLPDPSFTAGEGRKFYGWIVTDNTASGRVETSGFSNVSINVVEGKTYTATAYYGFDITLNGLPDGTTTMHGSVMCRNPEALVVPEFTESQMEGNAFMIMNESITSELSFTVQNATINCVQQDAESGSYMYAVTNITGPVTVTFNVSEPTPPPAGETCEHTNIVNHKCTNCGYCTIKFNYDPSRVALVAGTTFTRSDSWLSIGADKHSEYGISVDGAIGLQIRMVDYAILGEQNPNNAIQPEYTSEGIETGRAWNVLYALSDGGVISENNQYALYVNLYNGGANYQGTNKFGSTGDVFGPITTSTGAKVYGIVTNGGDNVKFAVPVTFKPPCEHSWSTQKNEKGHWGTCTLCGTANGTVDSPEFHTDANLDNKCDVCEYVVYHVDIDKSYFSGSIYAIQMQDSTGNVFLSGLDETATLLVPAGCKLEVYCSKEIKKAEAIGAKTVLANGEGGYNSACIASNFTCNTTIVLDPPIIITLDKSHFDGEWITLITYDDQGHSYEDVSASENLEAVMPEGGHVKVFASEKIVIKADGANPAEYLGGNIDEGHMYQIDGITGSITVVINPPAPAPTPTPDNGSNGGSSSSSSSSSTPSTSTPSTSTPSTAPITVPVSNGGNDNVLNINASLSGETAKVNELTAEEIDKVAKNETKDSIEINLSETGKTVKEAALPVSSLNEIARIMDDPSNKLDNVTIKLSTATVEISEHALKAVLSKTSGNDLRLVVDDIHKDTLNNTQKESVKNQNVHMCIDAYFISNGVRIGDFQGGTATIRLPFNVPAGHNRNGFSVWYVGDDGTIEKHDTRYVNRELVFTVSHFSDYVVVYDGAVKDNVPKTGEAADYTTLVWTSILAIGVLGLVLNRQKRR